MKDPEKKKIDYVILKISMNDRFKRPLMIVGFFLVVAALAYGLYWMFFRPLPSPVAPTQPAQPSGALPSAGTGRPQGATTTEIGEGGLPVAPAQPFVPTIPTGIPQAPRGRVIANNISKAISVSQSGQIRGYNSDDGRFYRITPEGERVPLSAQVFNNVESVNWGKSTDKAVINFPDGSNILYDFANDRQVTLPKHWQDFEFSPDYDKIVAKSIGNNVDNRFLVVANPDGTNARAIEDLGNNFDKVQSSWSPNNQMVAYSFTGEPLGADRQQIIFLGQNQENFKGLIVEGRGFIPKWAPSGQNILYSVYNRGTGYIPTLWVSGASSDNMNSNRVKLQLNTWADKCAWQNDESLICGVPVVLDQGAALQRSLSQSTPDEIWKINLKTGEKINLGQPVANVSIENISITPDGKSAIFNDVNTGRLIRYDL